MGLNPRALLTALLTVLILYAVSLAGWMSVRAPYARAAARTSTILFPVLALKGSVFAEPDKATTIVYILADPRSGGWARVFQRFLEFSDIPLAVALGLGLPLLRWRRRVSAAALACVLVFACHVGLILWSAASLRARLADLSITRDRLDAALYEVSVQVTGYGNISTMVTLLFVAAATALLHPGLTTPAERDRAGHTVAAAPRSEPVEHPAAPAHSAPVESRTANSAELQ